MKRLICCLFGLTIFISGCSQTAPQGVKAEPIDLSGRLGLKESQTWALYDYYDNTLLLLIYDAEKTNPIEGDRDQANSSYFEKFVLYDLASQSVLREYPMEQFGFCNSAVYAFDGILFSFMTEKTEGDGFDSSISYMNEQGIQTVYEGNFTPFDVGPMLYRNRDAVVFGYQDMENNQFGIQTIDADMQVEPLLTFDTGTGVDFISDDFKASSDYYTYTVGQENRVIFHIGSPATEPTQITLPEGEKIFSFDLTTDALIVSRTNQTGDLDDVFCVEIFDLEGNSLQVYPMDEPLYRICANAKQQFCGFYSDSPVEYFEIADGIEPVEVDTSAIDSTWNYAMSDGDQFIISSYLSPSLWLLS